MTGLMNSFQVFNVYIDRAMELLTDSEFRVLMYATRHITGWQDKINERQGHISISMFEKGFTTHSGTRFAGCGLNRQTIIDAIGSLVEFGFLERDGKPTAKGQKFTLCTEGIDWAKLEERHQEQQQKAKQRTAKANEKRRGGTSDNTGTLDNTMQGTSDNTMLSTLDNTQTKTYSKPSKKTDELPPDVSKWNEFQLNGYYDLHRAELKVIAVAIGIDIKTVAWKHWTLAERRNVIKRHRLVIQSGLDTSQYTEYLLTKFSWHKNGLLNLSDYDNNVSEYKTWLASQNSEAAQTAVEKAEFHIAMMLGSQEVSDDPTAA